ncbi:galactofuranosyltransferase [Ligilactobacillus sp. WILCCON 0076]|uniref:Galactofuranosyltransferase n=1 Tax=Ligilactobacillus ubinensis TaxID=2876789 RepID=A0A9X2FKH5_9LACO|nr:galactofuranosyltransferase [Ligilactobacillus ubinensis]MCP0886869.1 galactofuranosyltransferase [Ligilactobacillus ubinensis]
MNYFIKEELYSNSRTMKSAASKARNDIEIILKDSGFNPIVIKILPRKGNLNYISTDRKNHQEVADLWKKETKRLLKNDLLFIQFPFLQHSIFLEAVLSNLKKRGIRVIVLLNDIESLRVVKRDDISDDKKRILMTEENFIYDISNKIVVHNFKMKNFLINKNIKRDKIIQLEAFDYLIPQYDEDRMKKRSVTPTDPIIIAGTLRRHKSQYLNYLPADIAFNLYGVGYTEKEQANISYKGAFSPNELPYYLSGSFGLVWDGDSCKTCNGIYGDYLRINTPHKLSLYLAAGIPIIIWKQAAMAKFVLENGCGLVIDSLEDIKEKQVKVSFDEYSHFYYCANQVGKKLREGYYTKKILDSIRTLEKIE